MKNQFVCDERDYLKYGLLRKISDNADVRIAVCWMLTADENSNDGNLTQYINKPDRWKVHDPELFSELKTIIDLNTIEGRKLCPVDHIKNSGILPGFKFYDSITDVTSENNFDLIFFDPDVGLVPPSGCKEPEKYLPWNVVKDFYNNKRKSLLIFQFLHSAGRKHWLSDIASKCANIRACTEAKTIYSFLTNSVVYLLVPQQNHLNRFRFESLESSLAKSWGNRIKMKEEI